MTVYEQELRKLFEHSNLVDRPQFSGRVCVGDLGKDLRVRAEFLSTHISSQYDAIRLTVLNRTRDTFVLSGKSRSVIRGIGRETLKPLQKEVSHMKTKMLKKRGVER